MQCSKDCRDASRREWYEGPSLSSRKSSAGIAQLVEHNLAKVGVAGSSPVSRSGVFLVGVVGRLAQLVRAPR